MKTKGKVWIGDFPATEPLLHYKGSKLNPAVESCLYVCRRHTRKQPSLNPVPLDSSKVICKFMTSVETQGSILRLRCCRRPWSWMSTGGSGITRPLLNLWYTSVESDATAHRSMEVPLLKTHCTSLWLRLLWAGSGRTTCSASPPFSKPLRRTTSSLGQVKLDTHLQCRTSVRSMKTRNAAWTWALSPTSSCMKSRNFGCCKIQLGVSR